MNETIGRLLTLGNVAKVFEWASRVVKLYNFAAGNQTAFRERQFTQPSTQWEFQCPRSGARKRLQTDGGSCSIGEVRIIRRTNVERFR
jgi:hypothetical protein